MITFDYINAAVPCEEFAKTNSDPGAGYENAGNYACKVLLGAARRDPVGFGKALDAYRLNPYGPELEDLLTPEERSALMDGKWGITGFQWGWACQTAAFLLEQAPVPNGAILTIEVSS